MALGKYTDVYTAEALNERVIEIVDASRELRQNGSAYFESLKSDVRHQIEVLEKKRDNIFAILRVKDIEDLNNRIKQYQNAVFRFTGQELDQCIISVLTEENEKFNRLMGNAINTIIGERIKPEEYLFADGSKNLEYFKKRYIEELNALFGQNLFSSKKGITMDGIFYAGLTKEQQRAWKKIIANKVGLETGYDEKQLMEKLEIDEQLNGNTDTIQFNWFDIISASTGKPLTPTEAEKLPSDKIDEINRQIKQRILSMVDGSDGPLISKIIDYVLSESKNLAFFSGRNTKDIIGILGEISAIYYISKLVSDDGEAPDSRIGNSIQWLGGLHVGNNNQKPHRDVLLEGLGIQVKNTTKDYLSRVSFADATIDTVLEKTNLSTDAKDLVKNYYGTLSFNVPYDIRNNMYVHGGPIDVGEATEVYKNAIKNLKEAENNVNELINLCAAALMYMDVAEKGEELDGNVLYLVGSTFFAASEMLDKILKEVEDKEKKIKTFRVEVSMNSDKTIVEALNDNFRGANYSSAVIGQIVLTSSYNFGAL